MTPIVKFKAFHEPSRTLLDWSTIIQSAWNNKDSWLLYTILVAKKPEWVILPYVGRKDINSKEICVGDECRCFNLSQSEPLLGVIEYNDELTAFVLRLKTNNSYSVLYGFHEIEIIRSIYDNPSESIER
jgi:hypothetical protein